MRELPLQCAWCRRVYHEGAVHEPPLASLVAEATHGACPDCAALLLGRERDRLRAAGKEQEAILTEWRRLELLMALVRSRVARALGRSRTLRLRAALTRARSRALRAGRSPTGTVAL